MANGELVVKIILIVCNAILTLTVVANIIVAFVNISKPSKYYDIVSIYVGKSATIVQIIINAIVVVIIIGWFGILKKRRTCLLIYAIVGLIYGVALLIFGIAVLVKGIEAGRYLITYKLKQTYEDYPTNQVAKTMIDDMHAYYKCCGADKPILINNEYPKSCCQALDDGKCLRPYQKSCGDALLTEHTTEVIGSTSIILALFLSCAGISAIIYRRYLLPVQQLHM